MQTVSDELCREYGLSVIEHPQQGQGKQYGEWRAEQEQRPTWRGLIRADIDEAIRQAMTERQFLTLCGKRAMRSRSARIFRSDRRARERFVRLMRNFGEDYSIEQIRRRILSQTRAEKKPSEPTRQVIRIRLFGSLKKPPKTDRLSGAVCSLLLSAGHLPEEPSAAKQKTAALHSLAGGSAKAGRHHRRNKAAHGHRIDTAEQLFFIP